MQAARQFVHKKTGSLLALAMTPVHCFKAWVKNRRRLAVAHRGDVDAVRSRAVGVGHVCVGRERGREARFVDVAFDPPFVGAT